MMNKRAPVRVLDSPKTSCDANSSEHRKYPPDPKTGHSYSVSHAAAKGCTVKETVDRAVGPTPLPPGLHPTGSDLPSYFPMPPYLPDPRNNNFLDASFASYQPFFYGPPHVPYPFNQPLAVNSTTNEGRYQWPPTHRFGCTPSSALPDLPSTASSLLAGSVLSGADADASSSASRLQLECYQRMVAAAIHYSPYNLTPPPPGLGLPGSADYLPLAAAAAYMHHPALASLAAHRLSNSDQSPSAAGSADSSRGFASPRPSVTLKAGSRKRALSHSPLEFGFDIESLTRSSEGSLHLPSLSAGGRSSPPVGCSSGSYGHLSAASFSAPNSLPGSLPHSLFRHGVLPPSSFLNPAALGMFPWAQPLSGSATLPTALHLPMSSPSARTTDSKSDSQVTPATSARQELGGSSGVVSSTVDHHDSRDAARRYYIGLTRIKNEEFSPESDIYCDDRRHSPTDSHQDLQLMTHEGEPDFYETNCHWRGCNLEFETQDDLVRHLNQDHVSASRKQFVCQWDGCIRAEKPFKAQYMLVVHMRRHTGEKPHRCTFEGCNKAYSRLENLKTHLRSHTGEKPYLCEFPGCAKAFSNASDRAKHQNRTHSNAKPYVCKAYGCTKCYTDPSSLRKHVKTVHGADFYASKKHKGDEYGDHSCGGHIDPDGCFFNGDNSEDRKPDLLNTNSNSSGMGSGAASSSAGSPASKPDYQQNSLASPAAASPQAAVVDSERDAAVTQRHVAHHARRRPCTAVEHLQNLSVNDVLVTSSVDDHTELVETDAENVLNEIVLSGATVDGEDSVLIAPSVIGRAPIGRLQTRPKARGLAPTLPPLGNTRRMWPPASPRNGGGSDGGSHKLTTDLRHRRNNAGRHMSEIYNNRELSSVRNRYDSCASSALSSCLSTASSACSVHSADASPHPPSRYQHLSNASSSIAASPYEYDMAATSCESMNARIGTATSRRVPGTCLTDSAASDGDVSLSCRFAGRGSVSRFLAARRRESSDSGLVLDTHRTPGDFRRASDPVLNSTSDAADSTAAQRCQSATAAPQMMRSNRTVCSLMSSRSSIATNASVMSDEVELKFTPDSAEGQTIADRVVGDLIIPDEMRDFLNATYRPGTVDLNADSTVVDSPIAPTPVVDSTSAADETKLAETTPSSCMFVSRETVPPTASQMSPVNSITQPGVTTGSRMVHTVELQSPAADRQQPFISPTLATSNYYQPNGMPQVYNGNEQVQVSQVSQSWRANTSRLRNRTNPHAFSAMYSHPGNDPSAFNQHHPAAVDNDAAVRYRRNPHQMNWWARTHGYYPQHPAGFQPNYSLRSPQIPSQMMNVNNASMQMSPNCNQVTSSTDMLPQQDTAAVTDDDRLSSALNSICMADTEMGFLESLSSLSMDSSTNPTALSPTVLMAEPNRAVQRGPMYFDSVTSNMVVNDMGTALSQLQAEETKYLMSVRA